MEKRPSKGKDLDKLQPFVADTTILRPEIQASELQAPKTFSTIRQGTGTNALTKIRAIEGKNTVIDKISGTATITQGDYIITIPNYLQLKGLKTSTYQLLDAITVVFTESGAKSPTVAISLSEYMKCRGLKDRKEARAQAKADMDILKSVNIDWEEKRGKSSGRTGFISLADSGHIERNGDIVFTFGTTFYNILLGYPVMPYPDQLQRLNARKNPNSYYLLRKITEHKNMNVGKHNENIISVKTLLENTPYIPSFDEVMNKDRALTRRIVEPFERDMDALAETLKWEYCRSKGEDTSGIVSPPSYDDFIGLFVKVTWNSYPDQTARLARKAQRIEQSKAKKEKLELAKAKAKGKEEARIEAEERKQQEEETT